ncbi:TPA: hypothetical protein TUM56_001575 [Streptococcus equi subsp. zooepidemicus]|uniref:hypothetical protein n=1 Tax=Streptococcus equi TaxID=1336 RepID=UPI0002DA6617|nr:hypothetical protein [Streptococcus equi]MBT1195249.1 hypothetical protein [Streptococcus equi subsp. equi]MBT1204350.1 hypothetical protein [Streptococcus equi subsp. equi]MBT1204815.1 hypothetical protein [Streptococcus equi subsp. equi]MBT1206578.1 hypothetical protein [Streptococcus equi subsp. equi]MBT1208515.1 hypothetical protein [Streptococcus equi subsp. equi]
MEPITIVTAKSRPLGTFALLVSPFTCRGWLHQPKAKASDLACDDQGVLRRKKIARYLGIPSYHDKLASMITKS